MFDLVGKIKNLTHHWNKKGPPAFARGPSLGRKIPKKGSDGGGATALHRCELQGKNARSAPAHLSRTQTSFTHKKTARRRSARVERALG